MRQHTHDGSSAERTSARRRLLAVGGWLVAAAVMLVVNRVLAASDPEPVTWVSTMQIFTGGPGPAVCVGFALAELFVGYQQRRARRASAPCTDR